jgi:hypothetical protein
MIWTGESRLSEGKPGYNPEFHWQPVEVGA